MIITNTKAMVINMPGKKSEHIKSADKKAMGLLQRNIVLLRKEYGLTQQMVADALGINRGTYCNYENRTLPPQYLIIRLAQIYNISPDVFYKDDLKSNILSVKSSDSFSDDEYFNELTDSEKLLIMKYRLLKKADKAEICKIIDDKTNNE